MLSATFALSAFALHERWLKGLGCFSLPHALRLCWAFHNKSCGPFPIAIITFRNLPTSPGPRSSCPLAGCTPWCPWFGCILSFPRFRFTAHLMLSGKVLGWFRVSSFPCPLCPSLSLSVHPLSPSPHLAPPSLTQLLGAEHNHGTHTHPRASWILVLGWTLHTCLMLCWVQSCRCHSAESRGVLLKVTPQPH